MFKPSAVRAYQDSLRLHVLPVMGARRLADGRRADVQRLANRMLSDGASPSTIRNTITSLRVVFRHAVSLDEVAVNPCVGVQLPAVRGGRDRIAAPQEADALLAALDAGDRPLWATAFYTGLRRGELQALRWENVDLSGNVIYVTASHNRVAGTVPSAW